MKRSCAVVIPAISRTSSPRWSRGHPLGLRLILGLNTCITPVCFSSFFKERCSAHCHFKVGTLLITPFLLLNACHFPTISLSLLLKHISLCMSFDRFLFAFNIFIHVSDFTSIYDSFLCTQYCVPFEKKIFLLASRVYIYFHAEQT